MSHRRRYFSFLSRWVARLPCYFVSRSHSLYRRDWAATWALVHRLQYHELIWDTLCTPVIAHLRGDDLMKIWYYTTRNEEWRESEFKRCQDFLVPLVRRQYSKHFRTNPLLGNCRIWTCEAVHIEGSLLEHCAKVLRFVIAYLRRRFLFLRFGDRPRSEWVGIDSGRSRTQWFQGATWGFSLSDLGGPPQF